MIERSRMEGWNREVWMIKWKIMEEWWKVKESGNQEIG